MIQINLLRQYPSSAGTRILGWPSPRKVGTLLVLVILGHVGWQYLALLHRKSQAAARIETLGRRQKEAEATQSRLAQVKVRLTQLEEQLEAIEHLRKRQKGPLGLVNAITESLPRLPILWLTVLEEEDRVMSIEGEARSLASITDFITTLKRSPALTRVDLSGWEASDKTLRFRAESEISY